MKIQASLLSLLILGFLISCKDDEKQEAKKEDDKMTFKIKEENISYRSDTVSHNGFIAYDEDKKGMRPVVFIVHEWWGLDDYTKTRAKQLAELGYFAFAVDMYGEGKQGNDPASAEALAMPFYQKPQLIKTRLDAAMAKAGEYAQADLNNAAAIGYCFGGFCVLNAAKLVADLKGVVSFHGNLSGVPANKEKLKASVLVCHGGADPFVPQEEVDAFKKGMDSIGADYSFKTYPGATHAFTNPEATAKGKKFNIPVAYNAAADTASWNDMKAFFERIFKEK